jgi:hypothetical protein
MSVLYGHINFGFSSVQKIPLVNRLALFRMLNKFYLFWTVPNANISNFDRKFLRFDLKGDKYHISCRNLEIIHTPFERDFNFGLEMTFYDSKLIILL